MGLNFNGYVRKLMDGCQLRFVIVHAFWSRRTQGDDRTMVTRTQLPHVQVSYLIAVAFDHPPNFAGKVFVCGLIVEQYGTSVADQTP